MPKLTDEDVAELVRIFQPGYRTEYARRYEAGGPIRQASPRSYSYVATGGRPAGRATNGYSRSRVRPLTEEIPYDTGRGLEDELHGELIRRFAQARFGKAKYTVWEAKSDRPRIGCETWRELESELWRFYQAKRHVLWTRGEAYVWRALENYLEDARRVGSNRERIYRDRLHGYIMNFKKVHGVDDFTSLYYGERADDFDPSSFVS